MIEPMPASLATGSALTHYRIVSRLGVGGMGEVYLAQDTQLDRSVALKVLPAEVGQDTERLRRFTQEAKAASALNHPNVATIYEIGEADGVRFIAMEYVEGVPLSAKIATRALDTAEIVKIALQVAEALDEAHSKGVTHRDIKPANIMVTPRGQVKVLDFGLAKITRSPSEHVTEAAEATATDPGLVMGTVQYMSPEQALGREVDHRTDIFSFGIVLYQMAAGRLPFSGASPTETLDRILHAAAEPISDRTPELERIVRKKDRERRYYSARDLAVDLRSLEQPSQPIAAPVAAPRRRWGLVSAAAGLAAVLAVGLYFWLGRAKAIDSVAVLPFVNAGGNPDAEYLSDGITESLIDSLSQLPNLKVRSRDVVFRYKGKESTTQKAGTDLGVPVVLTGRLTQRGDNLAIRVELIDVKDNNQLWGQTYNRRLADVLAVQAEISRDVTEKLRIRLSGEEQKQLAKRPTENPEAFQLYLQGRFHLIKRTPEAHKKAIDLFTQAIAKDPNYARAHAGLADAYAYLAFDGGLPPKETMPKALDATKRALQIDEKLAEAHVSQGLIKRFYEWDWSGAEREFQRAIELNPNHAEAHHQYAALLAGLGRHDQALAEIQRARELEPLNLLINTHVGWILGIAGRHDAALEQFRKTNEMDPNFAHAYFDTGEVYEWMRNLPGAIAAYQKSLVLAGPQPEEMGYLARAYARAGNVAEARKLIGQIQAMSTRRYVSAYALSLAYEGLGDQEAMFQWLEKALEERSGGLVWIKVHITTDRAKADPRFHSALRRMGLDP